MYLEPTDYYQFPNPLTCSDSIVAVGGNLSPGMLISAYKQGIFPWYNSEDPILWQSPDPRFVLLPQNLHISSSMKKVLRQNIFEIRYDYDFRAVIKGCQGIKRPGQDGTWITGDMLSAYCKLHDLGFAHCAAAYQNDNLCGGCYGVILGKVFFGESMFTWKANASKASFLSWAQKLFASGIAFIDCQVHTDHLESLGACEVSKPDFLKMLKAQL
ncbi:MAG: leucyl/phenylalanyl-tRNA--protein transferase [Termitinemataceae bacterium]|nr:MAG: leucyl/phenylalanyl-tRNA--protein transferase [Termitinemataceae bacterium]